MPFISQDDVTFQRNRSINLFVSAANNPTSWNIVSSCRTYRLDGGTTGTVFRLIDCSGTGFIETIGSGSTLDVCVSSAPVVLSGDGSSSIVDICQAEILPPGLVFDTNTGTITGTPTDSGEYEITITATNCPGS